MGFRFRKSFGAGPFRVNLSKSGIGYSVGGKGFRFTKKAGGGTRTTASIPGTGVSYVKDSSGNKKYSANPQPNDPQMGKNPSYPVTMTELVLAWILGWIGAHKYYRKKTGIGILYLFTAGLCLVGWLGDAITLTLQYMAQKDGRSISGAKKFCVYALTTVFLVFLVSCSGGAGTNPLETLPATESTTETTVATTVPTETVIETTEAVTEPAETVIETTEPVIETTQAATEATTQPTEPTEEMVWIPTGGGTKYHSRSSCSNMDNPSHVTISQATARGFTPCKRCH